MHSCPTPFQAATNKDGLLRKEHIFPDPEDFTKKDKSGFLSQPSNCTPPNPGNLDPENNWRSFLCTSPSST